MLVWSTWNDALIEMCLLDAARSCRVHARMRVCVRERESFVPHGLPHWQRNFVHWLSGNNKLDKFRRIHVRFTVSVEFMSRFNFSLLTRTSVISCHFALDCRSLHSLDTDSKARNAQAREPLAKGSGLWNKTGCHKVVLAMVAKIACGSWQLYY